MQIIVNEKETSDTPGSPLAVLTKYGVPFTIELVEWTGDDPDELFPMKSDRRPRREVSFSLDSCEEEQTLHFLVDLLETVSFCEPWEIVRHDI